VRRVWVTVLMFAAGCGGRRIPETRAIAGGGTEVEVTSLVERALEADAKAESADSLYAPHAVIIADGAVRRTTPRFAGVGREGEVAITNTQMEIRGAVAWGDVEYRWVSDRSNRAEVARASFVAAPAQGRRGWWIVQAHSSTAK
jgi:hypothetical protein